MTTTTLVIAIIAVLAIAAALYMYFQKERTRKLRSQFGPEYHRLVAENKGDARRAEAELQRRAQRVQKFNIHSLPQQECDRFAAEWRRDQESFVDDPRNAVAKADELVTKAMVARGYPMSEFEQLAADISVDHPAVVENYRIAHEIASRDRAGKASTEDLRKAMVHYRRLFEDILDRRVSTEEVHQ